MGSELPRRRDDFGKQSLIGLLHYVAGVPCGPINDLAQVFADPQVQARGTRIRMAHPLAGEVDLVANPIRLSRTPVDYRRPPPLLGEHNAEVLTDWLND